MKAKSILYKIEFTLGNHTSYAVDIMDVYKLHPQLIYVTCHWEYNIIAGDMVNPENSHIRIKTPTILSSYEVPNVDTYPYRYEDF